VGEPRKSTCNTLGCIETTPACTDYSINPFVLQDFEAALKPLADVLRVMPITTITMFLEVISQEKALRRRGFYFMEKVAVKYWGTPGEKFVSNYIIAHVYSATNDGIFVIAKSGIRMFVLRDSILKLEEFIDIRRDLKEKGKLVDPTLSSRASSKQKLAITETLDDIIARGLVNDDDLDKDIKRKLNPKRIGDTIERATEDRRHEDRRSGSVRMSTGKGAEKVKKKGEKELDAADLFLRKAEKGLLTKADRDPSATLTKTKKKQPTAPVVAVVPAREIPSLFDNLKSKMRKNKTAKKNGGKK
jgi:hypothetical protein